MAKRSALDRVRDLYEVVCRQTLKIDHSAKETKEADEGAKMSLQMWEADIAGIVEHLIEGLPLEPPHYEWLEQPIILGTQIQFGPRFYDPKGPFDISHLPEVLIYAQNIEDLRRACVTYLSH